MTDDARYAAEAEPGIRRVAPPGSVVLVRRGMSLQAAYNAMLDEAAAMPGVDGLVLLHQDVELHDPAFGAALTTMLAEPGVAIVGVNGRRGAVGLREPGSAYVGHVCWGGPFEGPPAAGAAPVEVELVDGMLLALSPWAVRELRFDLAFEPTFHLYDRDICFQARARGRRVLVAETHVTHHFRRSALPSRADFVEALLLLERKWQPGGADPATPVESAAPPPADSEVAELRLRVRRMEESVTWARFVAASDRTYRLLGGRDSRRGRALAAALRSVGRGGE